MDDTATPRRTLVAVRVQDLLGQFNHSFDFSANSDFVILHGPNGVGKTRLLELINSTLNGWPDFSIPFRSLDLRFDDGSRLVLAQQKSAIFDVGDGLFPEELPGELNQESGEGWSWEWRVQEANGAEVSEPFENEEAVSSAFIYLMREGLIRRLALPRSGINLSTPHAVDVATGERLTKTEAIQRYLAEIPPDTLPLPLAVQSLLAKTSCRLIEVDRLRFSRESSDSASRYRETVEVAAPVRLADSLAKMMTESQADYAVEAQHRDRSYPQRLLSHERPRGTSVETVQSLAKSVAEERGRLAQAGLLLADESALPDVSSDLESWQRDALALHYEDALEKLKSLADLSSKITLFLQLVSAKMRNKEMVLDAKKGFYFKTPHGDLSPDLLSSGEQHEVVMAYRLIFETGPGQLVLIDEPEISLHVSWQRQFLADLERIADRTKARFIVATHSPQIVGTYRHRLVALGEVDD